MKKKGINIVALTIIEQHYEKEIQPLKDLYDRKYYQLEKELEMKGVEANKGKIRAIRRDLKAIEASLIAGVLLNQSYLKYLEQIVHLLQAAKAKVKEYESYLKYALLDVEPIEPEQYEKELKQIRT